MKTRLKIALEDARIRSWDELGKILCERYPDIDWPKPRSLGAKLGELNKGKTEWWIKRPDFVSKLIEVLQCAPQDLGLHLGLEHRNLYEFEDFPELQPLDLEKELPCELGNVINKEGKSAGDLDWWLPSIQFAFRVPHGISWVFFPKGTGKDIFWARVKSRSPYECIKSISVASQAERFKQPRPICLNVSDSEGVKDFLALTSRNKECSILVCAPFMLKDETDEQSYRDRYLSILGDSNVDRYEWQLHIDWRQRLLNWIEKRLASHPDSLFDAKGLSSWLEQFADQAIFDTPRNLVEICRFAHHYGHTKLPRGDDKAVGSKLVSLLHSERAEYRDEFVLLVHEWLSSLDLPWAGSIDGKRWSTLAISRHTHKREELLELIAKESDECKRRALLYRLENHLDTTKRSDLIDTPFLNQSETGDVSLAPRFLSDLLARERLCSLVLGKEHSEWAAFCFEPSRHELVQQALSLFTIDDLELCASHILKSYREDVFSIGATEALFCAVGRRDPLPGLIPSSLQTISEIVLKRMLATDSYGPSAWSSGSVNKVWWLVICWTWSLISPKPSFAIPDNWSAYFPGWSDFSHEIGWDWIVPSPKEKTPFNYLAASEKRLLERARKVADCLVKSPASSPKVLTPFLVLLGIQKNWTVPGEWWRVILENSWAQDLLVSELQKSQDLGTACLISFIDCASHDQSKYNPFKWFLIRPTSLRQCLLESSNPKQVIARFDDQSVMRAMGLFFLLDSTFSLEILDRYRQHKLALKWWMKFERNLSDELIDAVIPWIGNPGYESHLASKWLWTRAPEIAQEVLLGNSNLIVKQRLVTNFSGEIRFLPSIIKILKMNKTLLPDDELRAWVLNHLPTSAENAPELLELMPRESLE